MPLRIAVVRPFLCARKGGGERYAIETARSLAARGHAVEVFAHEWDRPEIPGVRYLRVPQIRKPAWLRVLSFHRGLRRLLDPDLYDAVLGLAPFAPQDLYHLSDGLERIWVRTNFPFGPTRWLRSLLRTVTLVNLLLERRILSGGARAVIANSRLLRDQAAREYGVPPERVPVIYPGVNRFRFHPAVRERSAAARAEFGLPQNGTVLLFVSNNFRRKGLAELLRAFAVVAARAPDLRLLIAGGGSFAPFRRLAARLGVADRVRPLGVMEEMEKVYAAADALIFPSRYDSFGLACLEAMACGLPVVATRMTGAAELLEDGVCGFVVASPDPALLADRIGRLLDPARREAMGKAAAAAARPFTLEAHADAFHAALSTAAERRRAGRIAEEWRGPGFVAGREFLPRLDRHGLGSADGWLEERRGELFLDREGRRTFRFRLEGPEGDQLLFVKRHTGRPGGAAAAAGLREWRNLRALLDRGIPTLTPVAAGERVREGIAESFTATVGLTDHEPLDRYAARRFAPPLDAARSREKREAIRALARLVRDFHWSGFDHRDLYLCHVFIRAAEKGTPDLRLLDLHRVERRRWFRRRWIVKDLAALHFSSLELPVSDRDRLRFLAGYAKGRGRAFPRRLARSILRKSLRIQRHNRKR